MSEVYAAINRVTEALVAHGIEKTRQNKDQNFMFRGIDDVYQAVAPLLAKNGLCVLPNVVSRTVEARKTKSGGDTYNVAVRVEFSFVSAKDGSAHIVATCGEANDTQDKATNKAMSAAYKYACFQAFCIPTEGDNDADAGRDSGWEHQMADFFLALEEADGMDAAKKVYKDALPFFRKAEDVAGAKRFKEKLLQLYPDADKKVAA